MVLSNIQCLVKYYIQIYIRMNMRSAPAIARVHMFESQLSSFEHLMTSVCARPANRPDVLWNFILFFFGFYFVISKDETNGGSDYCADDTVF